MLKLINRLYRGDTVTKDIINALEIKIADAEDKITDLYKQIFLSYADWYLAMKENEMAITDKSDDISVRRLAVKARLLGVGTVTKEMLESILNSFDGVTASVEFSDMTITITFDAVPSTAVLNAAVEAIAEIIPYHLDLIYVYNHVTWGEVAKVTWGDIANYTWGDLANGVAGTVSGE